MSKFSAKNGTSDIDVAYAANLARVQLTGEEENLFQEQLSQIVGYINELKLVDVAGADAMAHAAQIQNVVRADEPRPGLEREAVLANAPAQDGAQFLVPQIIG